MWAEPTKNNTPGTEKVLVGTRLIERQRERKGIEKIEIEIEKQYRGDRGEGDRARDR